MDSFPYRDRFVQALAFRDQLAGILFLAALGLLIWSYQAGKWGKVGSWLKIGGVIVYYAALVAVFLWVSSGN